MLAIAMGRVLEAWLINSRGMWDRSQAKAIIESQSTEDGGKNGV
jgi:hypothetical protein